MSLSSSVAVGRTSDELIEVYLHACDTALAEFDRTAEGKHARDAASPTTCSHGARPTVTDDVLGNGNRKRRRFELTRCVRIRGKEGHGGPK